MIRGIVVCVGYDDLLAVTLPRNMRHLAECLIVTHPDDEATRRVTALAPRARIFSTDAFYRHGAAFNKGLAMEEGFDALGRDGWIVVWDADTLFPDAMPLPKLRSECLYTPRRRILEDASRWSDDFDWRAAPLRGDKEFAGYFQLFHASAPWLAARPWYGTDWAHAGGCDSVFQRKAPCKIRPAFEVLHLGPCDTNWFGRVSNRLDGQPVDGAGGRQATMEQFLRSKGWGRRKIAQYFEERVMPATADADPCDDLGEGVGTEIHRLLAWLRIRPAKDDECGCCEFAEELNDLGPDWCERNVGQIVERLHEQARERGIPAVRLATEGMVRLAIARARRES